MRFWWPFRTKTPASVEIKCRPDDQLCHDIRNALLSLQQDRKMIIREYSDALKCLERLSKYVVSINGPMRRIELALATRTDHGEPGRE
jgi:hypothetical protein